MKACPRCKASGEIRLTPYDRQVCPLCDGAKEIRSMSPLPQSATRPTPREVPTMTPCPACAGRGRFVHELTDGTYFGNDCQFCSSLGMVTKEMLVIWNALSPTVKHLLSK